MQYRLKRKKQNKKCSKIILMKININNKEVLSESKKKKCKKTIA